MDSTSLDMQAVQNFLRLAKGAQSKEDFLSRVREFDQKFIDGYPAPVMNPLPNIPRSNSQTGSNFKPPANEPPKNPFLNSAQQKFRNQRQSQTMGQSKFPQTVPQSPQIPQMPIQPNRSRMMAPPQNIPHSRSETNFYRQDQELFENFAVNNTYANEFYDIDEAMYRQNMMNRSYSQQPDPRSKNPYPGTQPYIQNNEFLANYQTQEPEYIKYYKKVIPQQNPKANFSQTPRSNPFKQ